VENWEVEDKKTGLLSQRMTQKPGEFSDSVLLEDYGDHPTPASTVQMLEIFPGDKEQFQVARLQNQPRNLRRVNHAR
jgi:hypothetical protein